MDIEEDYGLFGVISGLFMTAWTVGIADIKFDLVQSNLLASGAVGRIYPIASILYILWVFSQDVTASCPPDHTTHKYGAQCVASDVIHSNTSTAMMSNVLKLKQKGPVLHRSLCTSSSSSSESLTKSVPSPSSTTPHRFSQVCVVAARRTPIGAFQGSLASLSATRLGSIAIKGALEDAKIQSKFIEEVYMGNVLSGGLGQAPARQAALEAGLLPSAVCTTVNKVCSSGMKAVMLGAQAIMLGLREVVVAGGMESMSNAPFLLPRVRSTKHLGDFNLIDSLVHDGLKDPLKNVSMGIFAEMCAEDMRISRSDQDDHAIKSFERATAAQATGLFKTEIVPVTVSGNKGKQINVVDFDEECSKFDPDKLENLPPVFKSNGTITAGNASSISDGAAALLLTSTMFAEKHGLPILAYIRGFSDAEQAPEKFPTSPSLAIPLALQQAGLHLKDIDLFEINEAFSNVDQLSSHVPLAQERETQVYDMYDPCCMGFHEEDLGIRSFWELR
ncbi:hypothetical protein GOP47_0007100 [Adiantum capillus-veneris]|uniref:Acetyl-CoA C-acetyltransferase n=1 Tax=Adiantum capillus-veneris TaxID=13818 RepID=A0A9D4ZL74_ADICA|nr:hypothetical protein GOP47_0007100 [Adiantum capillus-veneris]